MIDDLTRLAILNGTDKFGQHDYTPHYFGLLQHLRERPLKMFEIGVGGYGFPDRGGESLATWRDFFPKAEITGLDIQLKTLDLGPRVKIYQGSQVDPDCLTQIVEERGPFDVILDDGSHRNEHVVESFGLLFSTLKPGGIYLVEDVQTSFIPRFGGTLTLDAPNGVGMGIDWLQQLLRGDSDIVRVERFHNIIGLEKRDPEGTVPSAADDRRVTAGQGTVKRVSADQVSDADALSSLIADLEDGDTLLIEGLPDAALLSELFKQIDHVEIGLQFPDAPAPGPATRVLGMAAYGDGVVLQIGDNTYPSNFGFDIGHPRAAAAIQTLADVVADPAVTLTGLQQAASLVERYRGPEASAPLVARLEEMGSKDQRFYLMRVKQLTAARDWTGLEALCREALEHLPGDPHLLPHLATSLRQQHRGDEALALLRDAHEANPRQRSVVSALANLEFAAGNADRGIELWEKSMTLFPMTQRPELLRRLIVRCQKHGDEAAAQRAARRLLDIEPEDALGNFVLNQGQDSPAKQG